MKDDIAGGANDDLVDLSILVVVDDVVWWLIDIGSSRVVFAAENASTFVGPCAFQNR